MLTIRGPSRVYSIIKNKNGNFISGLINGDGIPSIQIFKFDADLINIISEENKAHNDKIFSIVQFDNGIVVSGSEDNLIKFWK